MPQNLRQLTIDEVSLVDRPANSSIDPATGRKVPRARIAIFKRDSVDKYHPDQMRDKGTWTDGNASDLATSANALTTSAKTADEHKAAADAHAKASMAHRFAAGSAAHVGHNTAAEKHLASAAEHNQKSVDHYVESIKKAETEPWDDNDLVCKAVDGKTEDGRAFPKSDYAYTPSDNVSEWKLRLTSTPGGTPDARIVGAAVAALGKGYRGNKVQIPSDALAGVKAKVRAAWHKANPDKGDDELPDILRKGDSPVAITLEQLAEKVEKQDGIIAAQKAEMDLLNKANETILKMSKKEKKAFAGMTDEKRKEYMAADTEKRKAMMDECAKAKVQKQLLETMTSVEVAKFEKAGASERVLMLEAQAAKVEKVKAKAKAKDNEEEPDEDDEDEEGDMNKKVKKADVIKFEVYERQVATLTDQITKAQETAANAQAQLVAIAKKGRLDHFIHKAEMELPNTSGSQVEKGTHLMALADALPGGEEGDVFKRVFDDMKAVDKAMLITFGEVGKSGGEAVPAEKAMELKAAEIAKRDKISVGKAMDKVFDENPELYIQYEKQQRAKQRSA